MATDYNLIAEEYRRAKHQPWRFYLERYTFFRLIGDLAGKSVLDLACGEGYYTRALKHKGAGRVVGIDLSSGMIDLARREEERKPLGIEYRVGDAKTVDEHGSFDLVVAAYLLNYAQTREELLAMCQAIARCLKPGGRFVSVNNHPEQSPEFFSEGLPYGFAKSTPGELREGAPIVWTIFLEKNTFDITNYYLSAATHEWAFRAAGLKDVRWHPPQLSPEAAGHFAPELWQCFLDHPPIVFFEATR